MLTNNDQARRHPIKAPLDTTKPCQQRRAHPARGAKPRASKKGSLHHMPHDNAVNTLRPSEYRNGSSINGF